MWQSEGLSPSALRSIIRLQSQDIKNTSGIAAGMKGEIMIRCHGMFSKYTVNLVDVMILSLH